jgi:sialic acid synthase SpsE
MEKSIKIIAEIGWNHMGNINLAKKMIKAAKLSGADICKFQTWSEKNLVNGPWDNDGRRKIYKKAELSINDHKKIINYCKKLKIGFLTSVFNLNDLKRLKKLNLSEMKIPSHEIHNDKLISEVTKNYKTIYISTGASKWKEILRLKKLILNKKNKNIYLMHCVSAYPCLATNINLPRINLLKKIKKNINIGYSGHLKGIDDGIASICYGATVVEKHFTINNDLPGRDNKNAILPNDLKTLCAFRDNFLLMKQFKGKNLQKCEYDIFKNYRGRWSLTIK